MAQLHILRALAEWLRSHGKTQKEIDQYAAEWAGLRAHDSLPCPKCLLEEPEETRRQPLVALKEFGSFEPLLCVHCKTKFMVEIPT